MSKKQLPTAALSLATSIAQTLDGNYTEEQIVYLQAKAMEESGFATSRLCVDFNNCFGMMQPNIRPTLSQGPTPAAEGDFATFQSQVQSIQDLKLYYDYWAANGKSGSPMVADVQSPRYASNTSYAQNIRNIIVAYWWPTADGQLIESDLQPVGSSAISTTSLVVLGLAVLFLASLGNKKVRRYGKKKVSKVRSYARKKATTYKAKRAAAARKKAALRRRTSKGVARKKGKTYKSDAYWRRRNAEMAARKKLKSRGY